MDGTTPRLPCSSWPTLKGTLWMWLSWCLKRLLKPVTRIGLVGALTDHYGSPGPLADYQRQFERTVRQDSEDPSKFAVALETLAVKAFGDMGPNARIRLIRDRFIAGHPNCDLRQHLDSVPPDTPIRDIVNRCRMWESHANTDDRRVVKPTPDKARPVYAVSEWTLVPTEQVVAVVTGPLVGLADFEAMLKRLLPAVPAQAPPPHSAPTDLEAILTHLFPGTLTGSVLNQIQGDQGVVIVYASRSLQLSLGLRHDVHPLPFIPPWCSIHLIHRPPVPPVAPEVSQWWCHACPMVYASRTILSHLQIPTRVPAR